MPHIFLTDRRISAAIATGSGMFALGLIIAAVFVPELRVLHFFQALIYTPWSRSHGGRVAMGFGTGLAVPVFWNVLAVFVTGDTRDGLRELGTLARTGQTQHPDVR